MLYLQGEPILAMGVDVGWVGGAQFEQNMHTCVADLSRLHSSLPKILVARGLYRRKLGRRRGPRGALFCWIQTVWQCCVAHTDHARANLARSTSQAHFPLSVSSRAWHL